MRVAKLHWAPSLSRCKPEQGEQKESAQETFTYYFLATLLAETMLREKA